MNLIEYYKKVVGTLGFYTTEDDFITIDAKGTTVWSNAGKSIVLPTKDHINTLLSEDDEGNPVINKIIYNPLDENVIRGDSVSIKKTKEAATLKLSHSLMVSGTMLMELATLKKHQSVPMYIQSFLARLKDVITTAKMVAVDEKSLENWRKLYAIAHKQNVGIVKIFLKKGGIDSKGVKHNRLATMKFPLYDLLCEVGDDKHVLGIPLRNKDIKVFKLLFEFLLKDENLSKFEYSSDDGESPAFISLMSLYVTHAKYPNKVIKAIKFIDEEQFDSGYIDINMNPEDFDIGSTFAKDLISIPTELDTNKQLAVPAPEPVVAPIVNPMDNQRDYRTTSMTPDSYQPVPQQQVQQTQQTPVDKNASVISSILRGNGQQPSLMPVQQQPQMVMPQQTMQVPVNSAPMGVDAIIQNNQMQNMYQQPMNAQPQYQPNQSVYNPMR